MRLRNVTAGAFGDTVRAMREGAGITPEQLADGTRVSLSYLDALERGASEPTLSIIEDLARALGVSTRAFVARCEATEASRRD